LELTGLNNAEVSQRELEGLVNKTAKGKSKNISEIFIENIFSVFNYIIAFIMGAILFFYFRTDDINLILDSIGVFTIAVTNTAIAIFQEIRAKRALDKVSLLLKKRVMVVRDGKETEIEQDEIVKDDVIKIGRGDQVAVDGIVLKSNHLEIDESLLTGESQPINKKDGNEILSGSFCLSGNGYYKAEKVGNESYAAQITDLAKKFKFSLTPLQKKINFIVKMLFTVALSLVVLEVIFNTPTYFDDVPFVRKMVTILIALIPQGLVLMASVSYAIGVYRISKIGAIIQKLNAIESFSNIKIVCMDKTGTLTQNKLAVEKVSLFTGRDDIESLVSTYAYYSSDKNATAGAIEKLGNHMRWEVIDEVPFSSENKLSMLKVKAEGKEKIYILGAYDILAEKLSQDNKETANKLSSENGLEVYRNLLFGEVSGGSFEDSQKYFDSISIDPYCIVSISDQVREDVMDAINLFRENGIQFKILTGDATYAVKAIVNKIGWDVTDNDLISGGELNMMTEEEFKEAVMNKLVFARLSPEHKLRIIKLLKAEGRYTAMLGDGVNDLPAIKEADMGIAMEEGSQITKEVADIVLLENKFSLLPEIFDEGKKIVNTVASMAKLFLTKNFLVIYLALLSLIFLLDFPLTPRRVAFINIFIIGLPALTIALKNSNTGKNTNFLPDLFSFVSISAFFIVAGSYCTMFLGQSFFPGASDAQIQMMMLVTMVIVSISNFYSVTLLEKQNSKAFYLIYGLLILVVFLLAAIIRSDFIILKAIREFYEIINLPFDYWVLTLSISAISAIVLFTAQILRKRVIGKIIH
jgi:cation-transporting ATPase E